MSVVTFCLSHVTCYMWNAYVDFWDMLNNFCFHVYAQKWVFVIMSHVTFRLSHVTCYMWNAYVDPLDMLNNFCFHVYAQKWVYVIMSHITCHCACHMSNAYVDIVSTEVYFSYKRSIIILIYNNGFYFSKTIRWAQNEYIWLHKTE